MTLSPREVWALLWGTIGLCLSGCVTAETAHPATGDLRLSYAMPEARGQDIPYRVFLPSAWTAQRNWPLVVALHGYAGTADSPFTDARGALQQEAERNGFVVVAPNGFNGMADYGANLPLPRALNRFDKPLTMSAQAESALAQADVLHVIDRAVRDYAIEPRRIFLMGNSMGMTGVLHLARLQPERWCAISASGGPPWRDYPVERLRSLAGALFVHGANDDIAQPADTIALARRAEEAGVNVEVHIVAGGTHGSAWVDYLPETFAFFARQHCREQATRRGVTPSASDAAS